MFELKTNELMKKGVCRYIDQHGNTVFMKRKGKGFVGRLRFMDKNVRLSPVEYDPMNVSSEGGFRLKIDYLDGRGCRTESVNDGISGFAEILQRWVSLVAEIADFRVDGECSDPEKGRREWGGKLAALTQYEELEPVMSLIFV